MAGGWLGVAGVAGVAGNPKVTEEILRYGGDVLENFPMMWERSANEPYLLLVLRVLPHRAAQPPSSAARCEERERRRKEKGREGEERGEKKRDSRNRKHSTFMCDTVGLAVASAVRVPVERATGLNTRAHNSEKRYDRPHVATHFYHLYTYTIDIQPENRVLVS